MKMSSSVSRVASLTKSTQAAVAPGKGIVEAGVQSLGFGDVDLELTTAHD